jgi:Ca2+-binding EF-hand superfamily protein
MSKIPEDQLAALKASFEELDKDKSGTLEADEVVTFLTVNGYPAGFGQIVFKAYDTNKDGKVQFEEFVTFIGDQLALAEGNSAPFFTAIFKGIDTDGSGSLSASELREFLKATGIPLEGDPLAELGSNTVSLEQFLQLFAQ